MADSESKLLVEGEEFRIYGRKVSGALYLYATMVAETTFCFEALYALWEERQTRSVNYSAHVEFRQYLIKHKYASDKVYKTFALSENGLEILK